MKAKIKKSVLPPGLAQTIFFSILSFPLISLHEKTEA
jgi:hypothetical protein